jgi:type I restriction enzyme S subunit
MVPLGSLLTDIQPGFASGCHNSDGNGIAHFRPMNISAEGRIVRGVTKYVDPTAARPNLHLSPGDILFNNTNSPELVGKTALFEGDDMPAFSNHMTRLRVDCNRLDARYAALRLHQAWREGWFAAHCNNHVSQASIGRDVLKSLEIELPPLDVQRAIASLSDAVDISRSSASDHLSAARTAIQRFRQAVLAAACSGRLTADWRETRGLLEWEPERAAVVCSKVQSGSTPKVWYAETDGVPFLKVYNIVDQRIDFDYRPQFISPEFFRSAFARTAALPGDVLMNIVGPPLGKVAVVTDQYPAWSINQALTLFRPSGRVTTQWLYIYLCSGISVAEVMNDTKGTVGQVNISLSQCRDFVIPVPAIEEQAEISHRVNSLLALSDAVARRISAASTAVGRSSQAVLAKALRGELLPNEAEVAF